jgi:hypothetical protein
MLVKGPIGLIIMFHIGFINYKKIRHVFNYGAAQGTHKLVS